MWNGSMLRRPRSVWFERKIGIGTPLAGRPSHTTGHTLPYPAVRLVKTGTDKIHPACRALIKQNATDISASAALCR